MTSLCTGTRTLYLSGKRKGKGHSRRGHEGPKGGSGGIGVLFP